MPAKTNNPGTSRRRVTKAEEAKLARIQEEEMKARRQIWAVVLFASAIFLFLVTIIEGAKFWTVMHEIMFGLFGVCAFVWPALLLYLAILCAKDIPMDHVSSKVMQVGVLISSLGAAIHIFTPDAPELRLEIIIDLYTNGVARKGGGVFGGIPAALLTSWFGKTGACIIIFLLVFVFLMLVTGTTLLRFLATLYKPVRAARQNVEDDIQEYRSKREITPPQVKISDYPATPSARKVEFDFALDDDDELDARREAVRRNAARAKPEEEQKTAPEEEMEPIEEMASRASPKKQPAQKSAEPGRAALDVNPDIPILKTELPGTNYRFPPLELLDKSRAVSEIDIGDELKANAARLTSTLRSFGVETRIVNISRGPSVTRYELQPSAGVKISKITNLADDIALNLASAGVRIEAPIPNKAAVGIEVPNKNTSIVTMRELIDTSQFIKGKSKLTAALGKDITGNGIFADVAKMPHMLIAGATGSGKSVCINSLIVSLLYKARPDEVKFLMIDPKVVELGVYNGIPHLLVPVVTDPRKAAGALGWAVTEMLQRYKLFADNNVRDINGYNEHMSKFPNGQSLPQVVIIIDELADLMMAAPNDVEDAICRLAQMARAAGMHLVIATQRPSVDVITGVIKANIPSRISFAVSSQVDSRTILDMGGAEKLLGRGDMLYYPVGTAKPTRVQGCFVSDSEVERIVEFVKKAETAQYDDEISREIDKQAATEKSGKKGTGEDGDDGLDELFPQAVDCVIEAGLASTSLLQRRLKLGYARAARIIDQMEQKGVVGPFEGSKPRRVLVTRAQWLEKQAVDN